jgi:hypothetical protein
MDKLFVESAKKTKFFNIAKEFSNANLNDESEKDNYYLEFLK